MSSIYDDISDISDQEVDAVLTTIGVVAAKHQEAEYASQDFHPTFPYMLFNASYKTHKKPGASHRYFDKYMRNHDMTTICDYALQVNFASFSHKFSVITTTLLHETDTYTVQQHLEAYDRQMHEAHTTKGIRHAIKLRQCLHAAGVDSGTFYISLKRALYSSLPYELVKVTKSC